MTEGGSPQEISSHQPLGQRTVGGILWTLSEASVQGLLRTILFLVLARVTGPEAFGIMGAAMIVIHVAVVIGQLGFIQAIIQKGQLENSHIRLAFTLGLGWGAALTCGIALLAPAVANFFAFDGLEEVLRVIALIPLLSNAGLVAEGLLIRDFGFRKLAVVSVTSFVVGFGVVGLGLALLGGGVWALAAAYVTEPVIRTIVLIIIRPHAKRLCLNRAAFRDLLVIGGGFTGWRLAQVAAQSADNIVVGRWLGAEALGLYGRAYQITSIPNALLGRSLSMVLLPIMSRVQQNLPRLASVFCRTSSVLAVITLPAVAVVIVLAPELVLVLLGPDWVGVVLPLQILAPGIFFRLAFQVNIATLTAAGVVFSAAWRQTLFAANVFVGALVGQHWGLPGVAAGVSCAMLLHFIVISLHGMRVTSIPVSDFLTAHVRGLVLASLLGAEIFAIAHILRGAGVAPSWILATCGLAVAVSVGLPLKLIPNTLIGSDGLWLIRSVAARVQAKASGQSPG